MKIYKVKIYRPNPKTKSLELWTVTYWKDLERGISDARNIIETSNHENLVLDYDTIYLQD